MSDIFKGQVSSGFLNYLLKWRNHRSVPSHSCEFVKVILNSMLDQFFLKQRSSINSAIITCSVCKAVLSKKEHADPDRT